MLLMIDNYDSFTYNLVQYLGELGQDVRVYRNDQITLDQIVALAPERIVISPGPCTPNEAGISLALIERFKDSIPILGVCLGHQSIGQAFGGRVVHAGNIMHGKTSEIYHNRTDVFKGLDSPFTATRYHSLVIEKESLPACLEITAWTRTARGDMDEIMGVRHRDYPVSGVQFHPESILTSHGHELLNNFSPDEMIYVHGLNLFSPAGKGTGNTPPPLQGEGWDGGVILTLPPRTLILPLPGEGIELWISNKHCNDS